MRTKIKGININNERSSTNDSILKTHPHVNEKGNQIIEQDKNVVEWINTSLISQVKKIGLEPELILFR